MFGSIIVFILVLSVLVIVHELGHFIVARKSGVKVEEFGFGLPPRIWGKKVGETLYSINALPFGGFVKLHGEQEEDPETNIKRSFLHKSKKVRAAIVVAGVIMNFILAIFVFAIVYSFSGIPRDMGKVKVINVTTDSPAQKAGIVVGDIVTKVGDEEVTSSDNFIAKTANYKERAVTYEIQRVVDSQGKAIKVKLTPRENPPEGEGPIGVTITTMEIYYPPILQRPFYGVYYGFKEGIYWGKTIVTGLGGLATGIFRGEAVSGVSGPIGIYAVTTEASKGGFLTLLNFVGILSVNLAILNIIPFPALDGGRLLFIGIEAATRKKVSTRVEAIINNIGFLLLITLLLVITIGDVRRLITTGSIEGFINSLTK
ncbi:MAG: Membrane-associated zinc metalloprotease [Candidatus Woesebacteria bacterium GW2011_GWD1_41_12]|uniref:Membrane-associated zinc metalloprotease n=1 Tax=Candidatus Woesebacteria bacterium GW2011_GWD1_41_12 TaxID=1618593 RepID=A0A0G0ULN3_9BACT|nr:MAG: Membrane-associated zinc metalloprotease [Candidatus Woesebacteria bacterium GW2011_GWD1_41_12]